MKLYRNIWMNLPENYINIYPDQITIFDDRQIYGNISYVANDPVTVHNNLIVGNLERQQELIQKLESMQWRN